MPEQLLMQLFQLGINKGYPRIIHGQLICNMSVEYKEGQYGIPRGQGFG
jgi:hypothetical protein